MGPGGVDGLCIFVIVASERRRSDGFETNRCDSEDRVLYSNGSGRFSLGFVVRV